jgi:hypothetical protein
MTAASDVTTAVADVKADAAVVVSDFEFLKANWLKVYLFIVSSGLAGFLLGHKI